MAAASAAAKFMPIAAKRYPRTTARDGAEARYWQHFDRKVVSKHMAKITRIDVCGAAPHDLAVCTSTRVEIIAGDTLQPKRTVSRFTDVALSAAFRHNDGKLLVAGSADASVRVFDLASRNILRTFTGHTGAVHCVGFDAGSSSSSSSSSSSGAGGSGSAYQRVFSGSDDATVRLWDMVTQQCVSVLRGHTDHVRTVVANPYTSDSILSASYDHTVRVWDTRLADIDADGKPDTGAGSAADEKSAPARGCVMTMRHGAPVEDMVLLSGGGLVVTAGENKVSVWDILGGGRCLQSWSPHQKTITSLTTDRAMTRLLTASLDAHVKVFDLNTYEQTYDFKYSAPVLAVRLSPDSNVLAAGMADGTLALRQNKSVHAGDALTAPWRAPKAGTKRYFQRGASTVAGEDDFAVAVEHKAKLRPYDIFLKKFQYHQALDAALQTKRPEIVMSVLEELLLRGGLRSSLANRNETTLTPMLDFCVRYLTQPRQSSLLCDVTNMLLDIYTPTLGQSMSVDEKLLQLKQKVEHETQTQKALYQVLGALDILLAANNLVTAPAAPAAAVATPAAPAGELQTANVAAAPPTPGQARSALSAGGVGAAAAASTGTTVLMSLLAAITSTGPAAAAAASSSSTAAAAAARPATVAEESDAAVDADADVDGDGTDTAAAGQPATAAAAAAPVSAGAKRRAAAAAPTEPAAKRASKRK